MCNSEIPSINALPTVPLGLRTTYKENIKTSQIEILFESTIRIPDFFYSLDSMLDPGISIKKHHSITNTQTNSNSPSYQN